MAGGRCRGAASSRIPCWSNGRRTGATREGRRAVVVGCGPGADGEYLAGLGFDIVGFDISETAIRLAEQCAPGSSVHYVTADLLDPPAQWLRAYDLVVEMITVQANPASGSSHWRRVPGSA